MKKINLKKSNILEGLGKTKKIHETYGSQPQEILVSEEQLTRLMEKQYNEQLTPPADPAIADSEDFYTDMTVTNEEEIFDDYRHERRPSHDKGGGGHRPSYEEGEFTPGYTADQSAEGFDEDEIGAYLNMDKLRDYEMGEGYEDIDHSDRSEFDGRKSRVVGVDSNIKQQRIEEEGDVEDNEENREKVRQTKKAMDALEKFNSVALEEDSEGEETYNYGADEGHDEYRLKHDDMSRSHRSALKKDMGYDEDHEDRGEYGTHFESVDNLYHKSQLEQLDLMVEETFTEIRKSIVKERIRGLARKNYLLVEQSEWSGGRNPGVSAASGIENIVANLKKAWTFIKDEKTRHQIMNTLTKLNNFMTYSAELIGSGASQRAPRSYDQVANPLPFPDLDEPEELEDIDDEISLGEEYAEIELE